LAIFITPRTAPISPSKSRHPFQIGRTLGDAGRLLAKHWAPLLIAFVLLRMLPRVILGEDMDAGLVGNGRSFVAEMLQPLGDIWSNFTAKQIMEVPDYTFTAVATIVLLRDGRRPKWFGLMPTLMISLFLFALLLMIDVQPLLFELPPLATIPLLLLMLPIVLAVSMANAAAADERRWPVSAIGRSIALALKGPFRLMVLFLVMGILLWLSQTAEELMLKAIPVTDANWFDWATTMFQECISGFYLPFEAAITVAAFLHLRRRADGEKPEDTAAIFD
jgi:hypothetical protein